MIAELILLLITYWLYMFIKILWILFFYKQPDQTDSYDHSPWESC